MILHNLIEEELNSDICRKNQAIMLIYKCAVQIKIESEIKKRSLSVSEAIKKGTDVADSILLFEKHDTIRLRIP